MSNNSFPQNGRLPRGWKWAELGDVCAQDRVTIPGDDLIGKTLPYIGGENIESNSGRMLFGSSSATDQQQIGISNTFKFDSRHVLYSKLRPYLNKVALPDFSGRCSTELIPLLPTDVDRIYLAWLLRLPETADYAMQWSTGSRMPRTDMTAFMRLPIPLPPLAEQKRIVSILNEQLAAVERARKAAEERLEAAQALREVHRELVFNRVASSRTKCIPLRDVIKSTRNGFGRRPKGLEHGPIVLRIAAVSSGEVNYGDTRRGSMTQNELDTYSLQPKDLLFVRVNGSQSLVGTCVEFNGYPEPVAFNDHLIRVRLTDRVLPSFVSEFCKLRTVRKFVEDQASTSAGQFTINRSTIEDIEIPMPNNKTQEQCVSEIRLFSQYVDRILGDVTYQRHLLDSLPPALLRRAFSGEI